MTPLSFSTLSPTTTLLLLLLLHHPSPTIGHGYLKSPRSRNYVAHADGVWSGGTSITPAKESCPHCLNLGGTLGRCGVVQGRSYDFPPSATGGVLEFNSQMMLTEGGELDLEVVLTAHHKGHFEYKACALGEGVDVPSQECFDSHPLIFMRDNLYGAVPHPDYPNRAYIPLNDGRLESDTSGGPSGYRFSHRYAFPIGLTGERVLIQWHYVTANSCLPEGYDSYDWPDGFHPGGLAGCGPLPHDGNGVPEQFWNCAEISILPAGPTTPTNPPAPTPPTPAPTRPPTPPIKPPTATPSQSPSKELSTPTVGGGGTPCGGGNVGNGICSDSSHCCSEWGWCGTSSAHCDGNNPPPPSPTTPPAPTPPTAPGAAVTDNRLIAYLGNWQSCPPLDQVKPYTHIVIGFAVTYTWSPSKNICSETCQIATPPICNNAPNPNLVTLWQSMGKKVLLSFGGAGMGGSWAGDNNDCWEYCYGKETQVVDRLLDIVEELGLDGIDIDYEYFYDNNQNGSGFAKGDEAKTFLNDVTLGLRAGLGPGKELAHAPMDPDLVPGKGYYDLVKQWGENDVLDFIMPQYYNGNTRPVNDPDGAMRHYSTLLNDAFKGDPTKMVFGFCISDCSGTGSNANGMQAAAMMTTVRDSYACNGGAFFWVAEHDGNAAWSSVINREIAPYRGCSRVKTPTASPTKLPTASPLETDEPTKSPTMSPTKSPTVSPVTPTNPPPPTLPPTPPPTLPPTPPPTLPPTPPPTHPPTNPPTKSPTNSPIATPPTDNCSLSCPPNYTGLKAYASCTKFYHCVSGTVAGRPLPCAAGTLFDESYNFCNWESQVTCPPCSPTVAPVAAPVAPSPPPTEPCCPAGFTGLRPYEGCRKYFHCVGGVVTGNPLPCAKGTLFDVGIQNCNWKNQVKCSGDEESCDRRRLRG